MLDPQAVLGQAGQGRAPASWRVFTKERGRVRGFLRGTSGDPDPLLVITPAGVVEYVDSKKPVAVVDFDIGAARVEPPVPASDVIPWIEADWPSEIEKDFGTPAKNRPSVSPMSAPGASL